MDFQGLKIDPKGEIKDDDFTLETVKKDDFANDKTLSKFKSDEPADNKILDKSKSGLGAMSIIVENQTSLSIFKKLKTKILKCDDCNMKV